MRRLRALLARFANRLNAAGGQACTGKPSLPKRKRRRRPGQAQRSRAERPSEAENRCTVAAYEAGLRAAGPQSGSPRPPGPPPRRVTLSCFFTRANRGLYVQQQKNGWYVQRKSWRKGSKATQGPEHASWSALRATGATGTLVHKRGQTNIECRKIRGMLSCGKLGANKSGQFKFREGG